LILFTASQLFQAVFGLSFSLVLILLSVQSGFCDSSGKFPGTGSYTNWKHAVDSSEDGVDYAQNGNYTMALRCYDEAIQLYPFDALFYFNKGIALKKTGKTKESIPVFAKAIELEPKFYSAWYNLGNAQQDNHDFPAAENSFKQALTQVWP
jgi:tetratricopeptide (TPR) repeat protein